LFPPHERANTLRAAASIPPIVLMAAVGCSALRRAVAREMEGPLGLLELTLRRRARSPADAGPPAPAWHLSLDVGRLLAGLFGLLLAAGFCAEAAESCRTVFVTYPSHQRFGGYPLARHLAGEIKHWLGIAPVYLKYAPSGIDVGQVKVYLASWGVGDEWQPDDIRAVAGCQLQEIAVAKPPFADPDRSPMVVLLYPADAQGEDIDRLRRLYPSNLVYPRYRPDGRLAYLVFLGLPPRASVDAYLPFCYNTPARATAPGGCSPPMRCAHA